MSREQQLEPVVEAIGLTRQFGKKVALDGVRLQVRPGRVFGLVGENGAGKTTFMKHALGLLKPTSGLMRVFGHDPVEDPVEVLSRIGYLSEDRDMPGWMRVGELMAYTRSFYPAWNDDYAEKLLQTFGLDTGTKVKNLSRGQKAQAGLLIALAYRPELLLLDEPSSGLDPVVRRDILSAIIRTVAEEGRTVVFSSHLLDEVERVADDVAMIHRGKVVMCGPLEDIKAGYRQATLWFERDPGTPPSAPNLLSCEGKGREWRVLCEGSEADLKNLFVDFKAEIVETDTPSLEDIFVACAGADRAALREG